MSSSPTTVTNIMTDINQVRTDMRERLEVYSRINFKMSEINPRVAYELGKMDQLSEDLIAINDAQKIPNEWYDQWIEEGVRDLVRHLRNNGVNTECSCEHEGYIQCQCILDGEMMRVHDLLFCYFAEHNLPINYEIVLTHQVIEGHSYSHYDIKLPIRKEKEHEQATTESGADD